MSNLAELLEGSGIEEGDDAGVEVEGTEVVEGEVEKTKTTEESGEQKAVKTTEEGKEESKQEKEESPYLTLEEQNRELRQMLRSQKRDISILQSKLDRVEKRSIQATKKVEKEVDEYEKLYGTEGKEEEGDTTEELSALELAQQELLTVAKQKAPVLETMVELMELTPKYQDVRDVCSQNNFQDIFDAVGEEISRKEGKDPSLASLEVEAAVWKMPNPYKYMYDIIKQYHPKYAGKETKEVKSNSTTTEPKKTPTSLANVPGKTSSKNAWTSARIDEMEVEELDSVPADIYDKYLKGELE